MSDWSVRPIRGADVDSLIALARSLGPGMTTLPADPDKIARKVESSVATFEGRADPAERQYILALTTPESEAILGIAAVYPDVGRQFGFFSFKIGKLVQRSRLLGRRELELLTLANDFTGATEVGSLCVHASLRGTGAARFLARSRYLLIGAFPELFDRRVMAEMRGWQSAEGVSPFWDAVGARFFDIGFEEADRLSAIEGAEFIAELLPKNPIYPALLPEAAREAIGRPHASSAPAMAMLLAEGFRYESYVDVFDAGPQVHAERDAIRTISRGRHVTLDAAHGVGAEHDLLVCTTSLERFRAIVCRGRTDGASASLDHAAQRRLGAAAREALLVSPQ